MVITNIETIAFSINEIHIVENEIYHAQIHLVRTDNPKTIPSPSLYPTLCNSLSFE